MQNKSIWINTEGKLEGHAGIETVIPWIQVRSDKEMNCALWHHIWFIYFEFIPSYCLNCWKVVVRPRTLKELFALYELQEDVAMGRACKCGIEIRDTVPAPYGGYFYNNSLEEGQECYRQVRWAVDHSLSPETSVILKRGCTEFELKHPQSNTWPAADSKQLEFEATLNGLFAMPPPFKGQPQYLINHIITKWIEHAYKYGDETYKLYTGGRPLYPPVVTYHESDPVENNGDQN